MGLKVRPTIAADPWFSLGTMWQAMHCTRTWNMWLGIIGVPRPPIPRYMLDHALVAALVALAAIELAGVLRSRGRGRRAGRLRPGGARPGEGEPQECQQQPGPDHRRPGMARSGPRSPCAVGAPTGGGSRCLISV